jgi:orotidine-5'-phosphate decarboxylase
VTWSRAVAEIVIALDLPGDAARRLLDQVPRVRWVKVGPTLYLREGPQLLRELTARGLQVFLDLKWHDIPNTVVGAVEAVRDSGVTMATVHTLGGEAMMAAAARAAGPALGLVGVTVLTSHDPAGYAATLGRSEVNLAEEVVRLARAAWRSGLRGVVCSPQEVARVRGECPPGGWIVVPGIRRPGDRTGDQARTAGPGDAARAGATHLVVGRPILEAADPARAFEEMAAEAG